MLQRELPRFVVPQENRDVEACGEAKRREASADSDQSLPDANHAEAQEEEDIAVRCVVCLAGLRCVLMLPCRHLCVCRACGLHESLRHCPLCRAPVQDRVVGLL